MASRTTGKSRSRSGSSRNGSRANARRKGNGSATVAEREYRDYAESPLAQTGENPDVLLDVPSLKVDEIYLKLAELDAHVAVKAQILDLVTLDVGIDVHLGEVEVEIEGVEAQALLKVRLDHVAAIVDRVMTTIDRNPEFVHSLSESLQDIGAGAGDMVGESGEAVEEVGEGAGKALPEIGEGAGGAVSSVGKGAGEAAQGLGEGAGQATQGLGQTLGGLDQGAGQATGDLGQLLGALGQGGGEGEAEGNGAGAGFKSSDLAKVVAKEIGSAATDEAKDLGLAATRKVKELGDRRRQRKLEKLNATEAASRHAEELGVDLHEVDGSGAEGRITVEDVKRAADA